MATSLEQASARPLSAEQQAAIAKFGFITEALQNPASIAADPQAFATRIEAATGKPMSAKDLDEMKAWATRAAAEPTAPSAITDPGQGSGPATPTGSDRYISGEAALHLGAPLFFGTLLETYARRHGWISGLSYFKRLRWHLIGAAEVVVGVILLAVGSAGSGGASKPQGPARSSLGASWPTLATVRASGPLPGLLASWEAMWQTDLGESTGGHVFRAQAREVRIDTQPSRLVEADGSSLGKTPITASIMPHALRSSYRRSDRPQRSDVMGQQGSRTSRAVDLSHQAGGARTGPRRQARGPVQPQPRGTPNARIFPVGTREPSRPTDPVAGGGDMARGVLRAKRLALVAMIPAVLLLASAGAALAWNPITGAGTCNVPPLGDLNIAIVGEYVYDVGGIINEHFEWTGVALPTGQPDWTHLTVGLFGPADDITGVSFAHAKFGSDSPVIWVRWVKDRKVVTRIDASPLCATPSPTPPASPSPSARPSPTPSSSAGPSASPSSSPSPKVTPTPSPSPSGGIQGATATPRRTAPATDTVGGSDSSGIGSSLPLLLVALVGINVGLVLNLRIPNRTYRRGRRS